MGLATIPAPSINTFFIYALVIVFASANVKLMLKLPFYSPNPSVGRRCKTPKGGEIFDDTSYDVVKNIFYLLNYIQLSLTFIHDSIVSMSGFLLCRDA